MPTKLQHSTPPKLHELYTKARRAFLTPSSLIQPGTLNLRQTHFRIISYQMAKVYPFSPLLPVNPIPGSLYVFIHCTWHKNMSFICGVRAQHLSTEVLRPAVPKAPSESILHHLNRFDDLGQSNVKIPSKHVQEMERGKEKLHARMVKSLVTLLQLIYTALTRPQESVKSCNLFIWYLANFQALLARECSNCLVMRMNKKYIVFLRNLESFVATSPKHL